VSPRWYEVWSGLLDTVPPEEGLIVNVSTYSICVKVAITDFAEFIVMVVGLAEPLRSPLHPVKLEPAAGVAVRVTIVPEAYVPPVGLREIEPVPEPAVDAVSVYVICVKFAATDFAESIVMVVGFVVPERSPLHPVKLEPSAGVAVRVTIVPDA
jgi:hypothetical protein